MSSGGVPLLAGLSEVAGRYDALLCDVWGVVHDGVRAFPPACEALVRFRAEGGRVILLTNAPRPGVIIHEQLDRLGVPRAAWDRVVTSGDVTRDMMAARPGEPLVHIGPPRDLPLFDGFEALRTTLPRAGYIVCTGLLDDEVETAADYTGTLAAARARNLPLICANPDLLVHRGGREVPCAGALAVAYAALGGAVAYAGKPHAPIYEMALREVAGLVGSGYRRGRVLAVGDAIRTDIAGAKGVGLDAVMILDGIHVEETRDLDEPGLARWLAGRAPQPDMALRILSW